MNNLNTYITKKLHINYQVDEKLQINKDTGKNLHFIPNNLTEFDNYIKLKIEEADGGSKENPVDLSFIDFTKIFEHDDSLGFIFDNYPNLEYVNVSNWILNGSKENSTITGLFCDINIKWINVSNWKFNNIVSIGGIFCGCEYLETIIGLDTWDVSKVRRFSKAFSLCKKLKTLDLSSWDVSSGLTFRAMFSDMFNLKSLNLSGWDVENASNIEKMFYYCTNLKTITGIENWKVSNITNFIETFYCCCSLDINLENWKVDFNKAALNEMFYSAKNKPSWYKE